MKVTEMLAQAEREGRTYWSFEFFPPRTAQVSQESTLSRFADCVGPSEFVRSYRKDEEPRTRVHRYHMVSSNFWIELQKLINRGAGGKNADLTSSLVQVCQENIGLECVMHLCCTESKPRDVPIRSKLTISARGESQVGPGCMIILH